MWTTFWDKTGLWDKNLVQIQFAKITRLGKFVIFRPKSGLMGQKSGQAKIFVPRSNHCGTRVSGLFGTKDQFYIKFYFENCKIYIKYLKNFWSFVPLTIFGQFLVKF